MMFGLLSLIVFALVLISSIIISRSITRPLNIITGLTGRLASGDGAFEVPYTARQDEIGGLAKSLHVVKDKAAAETKMPHEQAQANHQAEAAKRQTMTEIA